MTVRLRIDDRELEVAEGQTVLEAARAHGITIPTLCYHPSLSAAGSCRLCLVEVDGGPPRTACTLPVRAGLVVRTETEALARLRRRLLELLLADYAQAGPAGWQPNELMHWAEHYGAAVPEAVWQAPADGAGRDPNPFIWVDMNRCILCTRCVRACDEVQGRHVWGVAGRGAQARIVAGADQFLLDARCESCGACAAVCPTGALADRMSLGLGAPDRVVATICGYCGVGCQLDLNVRADRIIGVTSRPEAPVNGISLCVKGRYGYDFIHHPERLAKPRVRRSLLDGDSQRGRDDWVEVDWDSALDVTARRLAAIRRESGPDSIGLLASAKCTNEENYLMQKLARQVIGTHNVDHCARLCHASTVAGLALSLGSGAMSNTMDDVAEQAQALFVIGSNTTEQHPVFGARLRQAVERRGIPLVLADPRRIDLADFAALHLRHRPGTDVALLNGLMHIILEQGWHDQAFVGARCEGFAEFRAAVERYRPAWVAEVTGVPEADLRAAAELLASRRPMAVIWAMGITQHTTGVMNVLSLANLQLLLGNLGVQGGGVNPLRGQNNVQGACDLGGLPNVFPGYQAVGDAAVREKFEAAWKLSGRDRLFGDAPGLAVTEMIPRANGGGIRALYILGENPALTDADSNHVRACLQASEFTVVQEIFPSETAAYADVLLPGAAFAEKEGTFTNTERRIQRVRRAVAPPGEARPDWAVIAELGRRLLALDGTGPAGPQAGWDYPGPREIMDEIAALTPAYAGVSYERLDRGEALHWPVKGPDHPGTPILHVGTFTRGKGKFHAVDHLPAKELPDADYPLVLTTGRVLYHWHGGEMTRRARGLLEVYPRALVEINREDAAALGLNGDRTVRVTSRRGEMIAEAEITGRVPPGLVFGTFHFPGEQNVNNLTIGALDPVAKIPEFKVCAVRVERVEPGPEAAPAGSRMAAEPG